MKKIKLLIIGILLLSCGLSIAADKPVSQLTAATTIAADDLLMISYYNAGQYYSRKVLFSTLQSDVLAFMAANPLTLGTSQTHDGKIIFSSGTALNDYLFTIQASNFGANLTWTLPTTAPGGSNYLLNLDADGTMDYTDPATFQTKDADLDTYAGITPSANVQSILAAANYAAMKNLMGYYTSGDSPTFASVTVSKVSGVAGLMSAYEANSTDTSYIGWMGPASISESFSYQFSNTQPSAGQVMAFGAPAGDGDPNENKVSAQTWITPATIDGTETLTHKTIDVDGTGNTIKSWGYLVLSHPSSCGSDAPMQTTSTARTYGACKFGNDKDVTNNYAEYLLVVPPDMDTSVDLTAKFKFILSGADTADHDYIISMIDIADSTDNATATGDAVDLTYTADGNGASGDVESTGETTLTNWKSNATAGSLWYIRVSRDGDDGTNDASTVDSYSGPLVIKYKITQ